MHPDRPLACRLYPLGRHVHSDGTESFFHVKPHPQSHGEFTRTGTVADFLVTQDAHPFIQASDEYLFWLFAAHEHVNEAGDGQSESEFLRRGRVRCP